MPWDPAAELVRNLRRRHDLPKRPTMLRLVAVVGAYGCTVRTHGGLDGLGYYLPKPYPLIMLREGVPTVVLAHEFAHHLTLETLDAPPVHRYPLEPEDEPIAHRFSVLLCGEEALAEVPQPRRKRAQGAREPEPPLPTPREWFEAQLVFYVLDFGPEVMDLGRRLAAAVATMDDARAAAECVRVAFDGP